MRIGILGYGSIGGRHGFNATRLGHKVVIYDPLLNIHPRRHEVIVNHTDHSHSRRKALDEVDAVIIASPTKQHAQDILDCIEAGKPMLIEKPIIHPDPMMLNLVGEKLATGGVPAYMGFNLRFHQAARKAQEWLPRIGRPCGASDFQVLQKSTRPEYLRDGLISNWMSHEIDLATWLLGPAQVRRCQPEPDDQTKISLKLGHHGTDSFITADYVTDPEVRRFSIQGRDGLIAVDLVARTAELLPHDGESERFQATDSFDDNYFEEIKDWVAQIQGREGQCAPWSDGIAVQRIVNAAREAGGVK